MKKLSIVCFTLLLWISNAFANNEAFTEHCHAIALISFTIMTDRQAGMYAKDLYQKADIEGGKVGDLRIDELKEIVVLAFAVPLAMVQEHTLRQQYAKEFKSQMFLRCMA
jgi:hypothetical protein